MGTLVRFEDRSSKYEDSQRAAIIHDLDGDELVTVYLGRSVLKREFERQAPRPGDTIGLKYHGLKDTRDGLGNYHGYKMP